MTRTPYIAGICLLLLLATSCMEDSTEKMQQGIVQFTGVAISNFGTTAPNSRSLLDSDWQHIFPHTATLMVTNEATHEEYTLQYNPNDFSEGYAIELPYGTYSFFSQVEGAGLEGFLPFTIEGNFELSSQAMDISMEAKTSYGLITVKNEFVSEANLGGTPMELTEDDAFYYLYTLEDQEVVLTIQENFNQNQLTKTFTPEAYKHYHFYLKLQEADGQVNFIEMAIEPFEYHEDYFEIDKNASTVTDAAGNTYPVVKIGNQYWMAENLKSNTFCNGDDLLVPEDNYIDEYLNNNVPLVLLNSNYQTSNRGGYYTGDVILDERNICPCGWHISTDEDWKEMETYLGMPADALDNFRTYFNSDYRGSEQGVGSKIKATDWSNTFEDNDDATNETGFSAYNYNYYCCNEEPPGSSRGSFVYIDDSDYALWWSPQANGGEAMMGRMVEAGDAGIARQRFYRDLLYNIRCVKD